MMKPRRLLRLGVCLTALLLAPDVPRLRSGARALATFTPCPHPNPELDPQREQFRIPVEPYRVLGSSKPGAGPEDIDEPNGLAFDRHGYLLATDNQNLRLQLWDVKSGRQLRRFGAAPIIGDSEIVDVAVAPDGTALVTDEKTNRAYAFAPPEEEAGDGKTPSSYTYIDKDPLPGEKYKKLGGILIDKSSSIYTVDAELNEVRKHRWDGTRDPAWKFQQYRTEKEPFLKNAEGIAIDDDQHILYVASEFDYAIYLFDSRTGGFLQKLVGARYDLSSHAISGKRVFTGSRAVFSGSPEGLSLMRGYLFAVDEFAGHLHIFDTTNPAMFNRDLEDLAQLEKGERKSSGYVGFVGHTPVISHENPPYKKLIKHHKLNPAEYNSPGSLCSPDAVATYYDVQENEGYIAVADQCNYRIVVYRWSEIVQAAGLSRR